MANSTQGKLLSILGLTKSAELLVSPKTTLPWVIQAVGAPSWLLPLLMPIKESGSLIPQWFIRQSIFVHFPNRLLLWQAGAIAQCLAIFAIAIGSVTTTSVLFAILCLIALTLLSIGRAFCSLSMKEIQAHWVDKGERGHILGNADVMSGLITIVFAIGIIAIGDQLSLIALGALIGAGAILVGAAIVVTLSSRSVHVNVKGAKGRGWRQSVVQVRRDRTLKNLIISRVLVVHSVLAIPFIVSDTVASSVHSIGFFLILSALASVFSAKIWGDNSDRNAIHTLRIASLIGVIAIAFYVLVPSTEYSLWVSYAIFLILNVSHTGIRLARKTYLLDITNDQNRADYVAVGNTIVGVMLLVLGIGYAWLYSAIGDNLPVILACISVIGIFQSYQLTARKM